MYQKIYNNAPVLQADTTQEENSKLLIFQKIMNMIKSDINRVVVWYSIVYSILCYYRHAKHAAEYLIILKYFNINA